MSVFCQLQIVCLLIIEFRHFSLYFYFDTFNKCYYAILVEKSHYVEKL